MLFRLQPNALGAGFTADRSTLVALPARPEPILPLEGLCGERRADTEMPYSENRQRNRILDSSCPPEIAAPAGGVGLPQAAAIMQQDDKDSLFPRERSWFGRCRRE